MDKNKIRKGQVNISKAAGSEEMGSLCLYKCV